MTYQLLHFELSDIEFSDGRKSKLAKITLNSPPLNILSFSLLSDLSNALKQAEEEKCRAILITGGDSKAFIAGADISTMKKFSPHEAEDLIDQGQKIINKFENSSMITLAAINGFALGGGLELALACDIRILSEKATLGLPEVGLGVIPAFGGTQRLARLIGSGDAKYLILTGNYITADEAFRLGLAQVVAPHEKLLLESKKIIKKILTNGPLAVTLSKDLINSSFDIEFKQGLKNEKEYFSKLFQSGEAKEGLSAFTEKRSPKFKNI